MSESAAARRYRLANPEKERERHRIYREQNKEKIAAAAKDYQVRNKERIAEYNRAYHARPEVTERRRKQRQARASELRAYRAVNREKRAAQYREWYEKNRDYAIARGRAAWHTRRARIQGAIRVESIDRFAIYERDAGRCHICRRAVSRQAFHLDHLVPLSKGGDHTRDNIAVAHPKCNLRRNDGLIPAQLLLIGDV